MNDSTPEVPTEVAATDASADTSLPKKVASKRAPRRKKGEPVEALATSAGSDEGGHGAVQAGVRAGELPPPGPSQQGAGVEPPVAHEPAASEAADSSDVRGGHPGERKSPGGARAKPPP